MGWNSQEKDKRMKWEVKCGGPGRVCVCIILGAYGPSSPERPWPWPRPDLLGEMGERSRPTKAACVFHQEPEPLSSSARPQRRRDQSFRTEASGSRRVTVKRRAASFYQTRRIRSILAADLEGAGEQQRDKAPPTYL